MQDDTVVPLKCIVDISDLYKQYCSEFAINTVSDYLGGLHKLVELSCHFANLELNNQPTHYQQVLSKYMNGDHQDMRTNMMTINALKGFVNVLKPNFLLMLTRPNTLRALNYVQVLDATIHTPTTHYSDIPVETVLTMTTMVYWKTEVRYGLRQ